MVQTGDLLNQQWCKSRIVVGCATNHALVVITMSSTVLFPRVYQRLPASSIQNAGFDKVLPYQYVRTAVALLQNTCTTRLRQLHRSAYCAVEIQAHEMPHNDEPLIQPANPKVLWCTEVVYLFVTVPCPRCNIHQVLRQYARGIIGQHTWVSEFVWGKLSWCRPNFSNIAQFQVLKVAVVGLPNVGKSTLVNQLVGHKVSIVSPRVQTTRERVLGIATEGATQVLYMDTPGVIPYREGHRLRIARPLLTEANHALSEADVVLNMVDGRVSEAKGATTDTAWVDMLPTVETPDHCKHVLVVNKMDVLRKFPLILREIYLEAAALEGKSASRRSSANTGKTWRLCLEYVQGQLTIYIIYCLQS